MRSAEQIGRTVADWHDYQQRERERNLSAFLRMCRDARIAGEPWIGWVDAGCPDTSTPEGAPWRTQDARGRRSSPHAPRP